MSAKELVDQANKLAVVRREVEDEMARYCLDLSSRKVYHTADEGYAIRCQRFHQVDQDWQRAYAAATEALKKEAGLRPVEPAIFAVLRATRSR